MKRHIDTKNLSRVNALQETYLRAPVPLQNILVSLEGYRLERRRMGKGYEAIYKDVSERHNMDKRALEKYQRNRLRKHLQIAAKTTYWKRLFSDCRINLHTEDIVSELKKLPIINKSDIKPYIEQIRPDLPNKTKILPVHTAGTTGSGLYFWETVNAERERIATWWRFRRGYGINLKDMCGFFSGRVVIKRIDDNKPPFWRINKFGNQIIFSTHHLTEDNTKDYISAMRKFRVKWLSGYPSFIALLARYIKEQSIEAVESLKVITTGAENLLPNMRQIISEAFKVPVTQLYCQTEGIANFSECEKGNLHVDEDFSFVEFIPIEDRPDFYRIIGTNWTNPAFPLIRYDPGDLVSISNKECMCGKPGRVVKTINGRSGDFVILKDGRKIGRLNFIFQDMLFIKEAQIYQKQPGDITLRIVKAKGFNKNNEEEKLLAEAQKLLGQNMIISIEYLESIKKSSTGKIQFVISEVKNEESLESVGYL